MVIEDVEEAAVDDDVELDAEPVEVERIPNLEVRSQAALGGLGPSDLDGARGDVDAVRVAAVAGGRSACSPVPQPTSSTRPTILWASASATMLGWGRPISNGGEPR